MKLRANPAVVLIGLLTLLSSCSRDTPIAGDYKLYDLDGSNQVIIGNGGMVKVSDVTAYAVDGGRIIFETGLISADNIKEDVKSEQCMYGFIDAKNGKVAFAVGGSQLSKIVHDRLVASNRSAVSRSCIRKG